MIFMPPIYVAYVADVADKFLSATPQQSPNLSDL